MAGMHCVPSRPKRLKILRWRCRSRKSHDNSNTHTNHRRSQAFSDRQIMNDHQRYLMTGTSPDVPNSSAMVDFRRMFWEHRDKAGSEMNGKTSSEDDLANKRAMGDGIQSFKYAGNTYERDAVDDKIGDLMKLRGDYLKSIQNYDNKHSESSQKYVPPLLRQKRRSDSSSQLRCKWVKVPYPVTDDCYCSC